MNSPIKQQIINISFLFFVGLFSIFAIFLPDIDLSIPFLHHRSMVTHSILIPLLLMKWKRIKISNVVLLCLLLGFAIHMAADLSPKSWRGFALIYVPFVKISFFGAIGSYCWLLGNVILCFYFYSKIMREEHEEIPIYLSYILIGGMAVLYSWGSDGIGSGENLMVIVYSLLSFYLVNSKIFRKYIK